MTRTCPVPGCTAVIGPRNRSGVCRAHRHATGLCLCGLCCSRRGEEPPQREDLPTRNERQPRPITLARAPWEAGA